MKDKLYRKSFFKEKLKGAIGLILIVLAVASLFYWESYGREKFMFQEVIVFAKDIEENKIVEKSMLGIKKIDKTGLVEDVIMTPEEVIGKQTLTSVPKGLQLSPKFFGDAAMSTGDGKYVMAIPDDWLYSYPQTLRRGDTVFFYPMELDDDVGYYDPTGEYVKPENEGTVSSASSTKSALINTKVAYVKDTSNREIVDITPIRLDGVAQLSKIEIIITDEQFQVLKSNFEKGYKFIVMYE